MYIASSANRLTVNISLPEDAFSDVGGLAMFECRFSSLFSPLCNEWHVLEYYLQNDSSTTLSQKFSQLCESREDYNLTRDKYTLNVTITEDDLQRNYVYKYKFYIHDVSIINNNSILSCSLLSNSRIQWQNNATLILQLNMKLPETNSSGFSSAKIISPLTAISAVLLIVMISSCLFIYFWRRKKSNTQSSDKGNDHIVIKYSQTIWVHSKICCTINHVTMIVQSI